MIPKIIHQIWIGPAPKPMKLLNSWKESHPDFEYILWDENEILKRNMNFKCQKQIDSIKGPQEWAGKADIMRYEILEKYGGFYLDSDSICLNSIHSLCSNTAFACYENEEKRKHLVANGNIGTQAHNVLFKMIIDHISKQNYNFSEGGVELNSKKIVWKLTGPLLFTEFCLKYPTSIKILPSYLFLPTHPTGASYTGHCKVYAYQLWGTTNQKNNHLEREEVPADILSPEESVSILISFLNTKESYLKQALNSIINQQGYFWMEIVFVNDGSDELHTAMAKRLLRDIESNSRWISIKYIENRVNKGLGYSLNKGTQLASNEIVFRMDTDDIMFPERISIQLDFMKKNPTAALCGTQIKMFKVDKSNIIGETKHPTIKLKDYLMNPNLRKNHWLMNHPTFCFRKSMIIRIGNYNPLIHSMYEDFDLIIRVLKNYRIIYNLPVSLLYYRIHENQLTFNQDPKWTAIRNKIINMNMFKMRR